MYDHPYLRIVILITAFILIAYSLRNYFRFLEESKKPCEKPEKGTIPVLIWVNQEGRFVYRLHEKEEGNYFFQDLLANAEWNEDLAEENLGLALFTETEWQQAIDNGETVQ